MDYASLDRLAGDVLRELSAIHASCEGLGVVNEDTPQQIAHLATAAALEHKHSQLAKYHKMLAEGAKEFLLKNTDPNFEGDVGGLRVLHFTKKKFDDEGFWKWITRKGASDQEREVADMRGDYENFYKPFEKKARDEGNFSHLTSQLSVSIPKPTRKKARKR